MTEFLLFREKEEKKILFKTFFKEYQIRDIIDCLLVKYLF